MATDIKISQMPSAASLEGTELIPIVQGGTNRTTTPNKIKEGLATVAQLNNKVDKDGSKVLSEKNFTTAYETKLKGIADNANNYVHPTGNGNNHIPQGGAEGQFLGYSAEGTAKWVNAPSFSLSTATSSALGGIKIGYTQSDKNYPVVLDGDGKAYVIVPWTDTVYTHPTTAGNKHIPAGGSSGQILKWSAAGTAVWGAEKTYSEATSSVAGLMSSTDKAKLDGIEIGANNYIHPANHPATIITEDTTHRFVTDSEKTIWNAKATTAVASTSANGLMSSTDKSKLDGIASGANNYVLPVAGTSIGGVKQGVAVEDATSADDVITTVNALLASLRTSGAIATANTATASYSVMTASENDIIDFIPPMIIERGKLYKEDEVIYECIQTSKLPISNKLKDLVGYYVK